MIHKIWEKLQFVASIEIYVRKHRNEIFIQHASVATRPLESWHFGVADEAAPYAFQRAAATVSRLVQIRVKLHVTRATER
jgi:hypothetical protein